MPSHNTNKLCLSIDNEYYVECMDTHTHTHTHIYIYIYRWRLRVFDCLSHGGLTFTCT